MKKYIAIPLAVAGLAMMVACGSSPSETKAASEQKAVAPAKRTDGLLSDKGWALIDQKISKASYDTTYTGSMRVKNENADASTQTFTLTILKNGKSVGALQGSANEVAAGKTVTVQLISTDKYVKGPYTVEFQADF
jgi:hypothetical protein